VIAVVLKGYPRLSETFIAQEIHALEQAGIALRLVSLRQPTDRAVHPVHRAIRAPVSYLPEYLVQEPVRVLRAWRRARRLPGYRAARTVWLRDLARDRSPNRVRRFGQALVLASELDARVTRLHAHFLHTPASVARYAALLRGLPWSVSAHARDIWTSPEWEKREKLAAADFVVTCTRHNLEHLRALAPAGARVSLVYHGLDLARFAPVHAPAGTRRDGSEPAAPVRLLSVGRAVEKKGYEVLLAALARLPAELSWTLDHVGGGPLLGALRARAARDGIAPRIHWHGALPQEQVLAHYRGADLFVLASRIAADGDRDGLPNVLMEAQSQRLACLASEVSAVAELIVDGVTGELVAPDDASALACALERLIRDPARRARLAGAGEARVRGEFAMDAGIAQLLAQFGRDGAGEACAA
jgi:glycosyltransferase involved in cell wall biosynthesis